MEEKADYLVICNCGSFKPIPTYILQNYISIGIDYVYCDGCGEKNHLPKHIVKIAEDL